MRTDTKVRQEVMERLFKVNQPNISLSIPVNRFLPLYLAIFKYRTGGAQTAAVGPQVKLRFIFLVGYGIYLVRRIPK